MASAAPEVEAGASAAPGMGAEWLVPPMEGGSRVVEDANQFWQPSFGAASCKLTSMLYVEKPIKISCTAGHQT